MITVTFICDGDGCGAVAEAPTSLPALGLRRPDGWDLIYDPPTRDDTWPPYRTFCPVCWAKITHEPVETIRGTELKRYEVLVKRIVDAINAEHGATYVGKFHSEGSYSVAVTIANALADDAQGAVQARDVMRDALKEIEDDLAGWNPSEPGAIAHALQVARGTLDTYGASRP